MDKAFLLPIGQRQECSLTCPISPETIPQQFHLPSTANLFRQCQIRFSDPSSSSSEPSQCHTISIGDCIFLRPVDNSQRPSVAEVICFWSKNKSTRNPQVRLKWFYRGEDLPIVPTFSVGEDELFRTHHIDDCSAHSIAGRCLILSYPAWLQVSATAAAASTAAMACDHAPAASIANQSSSHSHSDSDSDTTSNSSFADNYSTSSLYFYVLNHFDLVSESVHPVSDNDSSHSEDDPVSDADDDFTPSFRSFNESRPRPRPRQRNRQRHSHIALPTGLDRGANIQCRDSQKKQISDFLTSTLLAVDNGPSASNCLYISGVPGTGKTASVREVVHLFQQDKGPSLNLQVVEINAMCLSDSNSVYTTLKNAGLQNAATINRRQKVSQFPVTASSCVAAPGAREMRKRVLVILDEVDSLVTRSQSLLYDILDWSSTVSHVAVICISNSMNLPEKMLPRISSRLGVNRLSFPPYTATELRTILQVLASNTTKYSQQAIRLCAGRVGAISGDVRRAMEIMQLAAELCQTEHGPETEVNAEMVDKAIQEMAEGCNIHSVEQTSRFERLVLCCSIVLQRDGVCAENLYLNQVLKKAQDEARRLGIHELSLRQLEEACWKLSARNIISTENTELMTTFSFRLNLRSEEILFAFRNCEESKRILQLS